MKNWVLGFVGGFAIGAFGMSMAAPLAVRVGGFSLRPNQSGIFLWSPSTGGYLTLDAVVQSLQGGHNDLVPRVEALERATNDGRD